MLSNHTLQVRCSGQCEREDDEPDVCTCMFLTGGYEVTLICPDEDGTTPLTVCGQWEVCGCPVPAVHGPVDAQGELSTFVTADGKELSEYDWIYELEALAPICPKSGLEHHYWEGTMFVSSHECFGRVCAENYDVESFESLKIYAPGDYPVIWTAGEGYADWELAKESEPDVAMVPA